MAMLDRAPTEPRPAGEALSAAGLQRLQAWLSPSFPVGAFSYSQGLEWAIEHGAVSDASSLLDWLSDILRFGSGRNDTILFAHSHRAAQTGDDGALRQVNELAIALQPSKERHLETTAQGRAFLSAVAAAWPNEGLAAAAAALQTEPHVAYPVAVAVAAASHRIAVEPAAIAYLGALVANLVSAGVRAIPIGQSDGQKAVAALAPLVEAVVAEALNASIDDIGGATLHADIASMQHETQYTRLFRS